MNNNNQIPMNSMANNIMNNFNQMNNQPMKVNPQPQQDVNISVFFRDAGLTRTGKVIENSENPPITIMCKYDEKVDDIIKRYRTKANFYEEDAKFIFNAKNLNPSLTVGEQGIQSNSNVFVISIKNIEGAA